MHVFGTNYFDLVWDSWSSTRANQIMIDSGRSATYQVPVAHYMYMY